MLSVGAVALQNHHDFAGALGGADDEVAQVAGLAHHVAELEAVLAAVVADEEADFVAGLGLEVAVLHVENLIEAGWGVEAEDVAVEGLGVVVDLRLGEPAVVAEGVFELVAVVGALGRGEDERNFGQGHFADAGELVDDLLLLEVQLGVVAQVLPLAAAAGAEVLAEGRGAQLGVGVEGRGHGFEEVLFGAGDAQIDHVAGGDLRNEDDEVVEANQALALGDHVLNQDILEGIGR